MSDPATDLENYEKNLPTYLEELSTLKSLIMAKPELYFELEVRSGIAEVAVIGPGGKGPLTEIAAAFFYEAFRAAAPAIFDDAIARAEASLDARAQQALATIAAKKNELTELEAKIKKGRKRK